MLTQPVAPDVTQTEPVLEWHVHLLRQQPRRLPRIAAAVVCVFLLSLVLFHSAWLALLPALATVFSLSEFLFPARYTLTMQSAKASFGLTTLEIPWRDVRHIYLAEDGVKLSPLASRNARWEPLQVSFCALGTQTKTKLLPPCAACATRRRQINTMSNGLFQFDWDAPLSDEERDKLLDGVAKTVRKWRMQIPFALFLESSAPLGRIAGQGLVAFSPFVAPALPGGLGDVQRLHKLLERPENLRQLIDMLVDTESNTEPNAARE